MDTEPNPALDRLRAQLVRSERTLSEDEASELDALLCASLERAAAATPEIVTVASPVSRPQRLQLDVLVSDPGLDAMYGRERAELGISSDGTCYLIYRRADGGDYAIVWSPATLLASSTMAMLPAVLASVMLEAAS